MEKPALEFVNELYSDDEVDAMIAQFQDKGWVILPDVLKRESVDPFVEQLEEIMFHDGLKYIPSEAGRLADRSTNLASGNAPHVPGDSFSVCIRHVRHAPLLWRRLSHASRPASGLDGS